MTCTLQIDGMGYVHVWRGDVNPRKVGNFLYVANGKEADLLVMGDEDIRSLLNNLSFVDEQQLKAGYAVTTKNTLNEYFTK